MLHVESVSPKQSYDRARYVARKAERERNKPPDPLMLISQIDLAYIAGIVDGEGSIFVAAVGPERRKTVYPIVCVAMTDEPLIEWLRERWQSGKVQTHNQTNLRKQNGHWKRQVRVMLFGRRAQLLCRLLLPYLRVKHGQALLVPTFPCDARIAPGQKIERSDINETRYRLRDEINGLNHQPRNSAARRHPSHVPTP